MKKLFFIIVVSIYSLQLNAQKVGLAVGCKTDKQGKWVAQLKFLFPESIISDKSTNVYRKTQNGAWEKISSASVTKAALTENINDEDYSFYKGYMSRKKTGNPEDENNSQALAGLMLVDNNTFAKYAGCYFEDATVTAGNTYQYRITDAASADKELAVSAAITIKADYLPAVSNITAIQKKQEVGINWDKSKVFYAYNVYRRDGASGRLEKITQEGIMLASVKGVANDKDEPKYYDSSLVAGTTVYYDVRGIDILGNESPSGTLVKLEVKDMLPPIAVKNLKGIKENHNAVITWTAPTGKDVKGYNVYRNNTVDTVYRKMNTTLLAADVTTFTDNQPQEGAVYGYIVESVDEAGNGARTRPAKVFFPDQTPPAKPTGLKAVTKPGTIQITWNKNAEQDLKGYFIYRSSSRDKDYFNMLNRYPVTANSFNDTLPGVAKNEFVYYVQAVDNSYNTSDPSDTVIVTLPDTAAPSMPIIRDITYSKGQVSFNADLRDEDGHAYDVYRSDDSANSKNYRKLNTNPLIAKAYTDNITEPGKAYHYYIISTDKAGNTSQPSQKRSIYADEEMAASAAVSGVKIQYSQTDTAATISWMNLSNAGGYIVYRKEADQKYTPVSGVLKETSFTDRPLEPGVNYMYKVRSFYTDADGYKDSEEVAVQAK